MTIWQATQQLDIDNLKTPTGKIISVMDMITEGDDFLQTECTIEDGYIYIGSMRYSDAEKDVVKTTPKEFTIGHRSQTKEQAAKLASDWHNPEMGYHTQVIKTDTGYQVRVVIN